MWREGRLASLEGTQNDRHARIDKFLLSVYVINCLMLYKLLEWPNRSRHFFVLRDFPHSLAFCELADILQNFSDSVLLELGQCMRADEGARSAPKNRPSFL